MARWKQFDDKWKVLTPLQRENEKVDFRWLTNGLTRERSMSRRRGKKNPAIQACPHCSQLNTLRRKKCSSCKKALMDAVLNEE
jgi:uncharacterized paraquat-inducible protein A